MTIKKTEISCFLPLLLVFLFLPAGFLFTEEASPPQYARSFNNGTALFQESRWMEAAAQFRQAQEITRNANDWSEALYWTIMSELAAADYGSALRDMDELEKAAIKNNRSTDIEYHRARAYYYLGYYEDALVMFNRFCGATVDEDLRKTSAFYWMGECLYFMGQLEKAEQFYNWIIARYPSSPKCELSFYRIDLIKQKKIETELLTILKWTHEEALRNSENYQRNISTREQYVNVSQNSVEKASGDSKKEGQRQELLNRARNLRNDAEIPTLEKILRGSQ
jgi:tetratricopeptide (TPR) repeat protein